MDGSCLEEDALRECGLARVNMGGDADIADTSGGI